MLPALALMEQAKATDDIPGQGRSPKGLAAAPLSQLGDYQILREVGRGGMGGSTAPATAAATRSSRSRPCSASTRWRCIASSRSSAPWPA
jgi:hypothetical protein